MIRVVHQGLGPIGREIAKLVLRDEKLEIVGAVDINPEFVGKDLGDLLGIGKLDIEVVDNAEELFKRTKPDVVVLATSSELSSIMPSLEIAIKSGVNVISPAEELFYPEFIDKEKAEYIDNLAKEYKVRVVGRGINPGCLMDSYPLSVFKRSGFVEIDSMKVCRWDDTSQRRRPLLEKTGAGLSKEEFYRLDKDGKLGHVGLRMSAKYLADKIGIEDPKIDFSRNPVIAKEDVGAKHLGVIKAGSVVGLNEVCTVALSGERSISLDLRMCVGASNCNSVEVVGIKDGGMENISENYSDIVNGDVATIRVLKEGIYRVIEGEVGLNRIDFVPNPHKLLKR